MMLIRWASRRENLLIVTGVEPMKVIRTRLANHIRASSREEWLHQQARHMTAPDRIVAMPTQHLTQGRRETRLIGKCSPGHRHCKDCGHHRGLNRSLDCRTFPL